MINAPKFDIAELIPHTGPMILLDRVVRYDADSLTAELTVRAGGVLGNGRGVPAWAGIEYMAQAVAAYVGVQARLAGEPIKLGYLLGTRRYAGNVAEFADGEKLTVTVTKIIQDDKLGAFACKITGAGIAITANLMVYQSPDSPQLS